MNDLEKQKIIELIEEIGPYYKGNDWLVIKKYLLRYLNPDIRRCFSTRDNKSKKHSLNDFEIEIIKLYFKTFNVELVLDESKRI